MTQAAQHCTVGGSVAEIVKMWDGVGALCYLNHHGARFLMWLRASRGPWPEMLPESRSKGGRVPKCVI